MDLNEGNINHITCVALAREKRTLTDSEKIELYDSIDCLVLDELAELYSIAMYENSMESKSTYLKFKIDAKGMGYCLVDRLFEFKNLGSLLTRGIAKLRKILN